MTGQKLADKHKQLKNNIILCLKWQAQVVLDNLWLIWLMVITFFDLPWSIIQWRHNAHKSKHCGEEPNH